VTNLSPSAQAIYDAFNRIGLYNEPSFDTDRKALAAALRAAADQCTYQDAWNDKFLSVEKLLAIAAELAGTTTTQEK
jgi:hypothetical protein